MKTPIQPRVLRASQAPAYLGMSEAIFNRDVRPHVQEFPVGDGGIGYDIHDLDLWLEEHKRKHATFRQDKKRAPPKPQAGMPLPRTENLKRFDQAVNNAKRKG